MTDLEEFVRGSNGVGSQPPWSMDAEPAAPDHEDGDSPSPGYEHKRTGGTSGSTQGELRIGNIPVDQLRQIVLETWRLSHLLGRHHPVGRRLLVILGEEER